MPAHVFHVPQPYRGQAPAEERASRSKFRWFGDTFRLSSRSRSANGRGSLTQEPQQNDEDDEFVMRTSPAKPLDYQYPVKQSHRTAGRSGNQLDADHTHKESRRGTSPFGSRNNSASESDGYDSLSEAEDSSFLRKIGLRRKKLHPTSPSSLNRVHTIASSRPTPVDDDGYDSLSDPEGTDPEFQVKGKRLSATSPMSFNSLRSSTASTVSTTLLSDYSPSSRSSFTSTVDGEATTATTAEILSPRVEYETRKLLRQVMGLDADWESDEHASRHYEQMNWRVVRIEADGNCLFRAISDQIYRNEAFHTDIRRRIVEFIHRKRELFRPFVENEQPGQMELIESYCERMQQDGQWGGNPELYAAARLFNVHIVVHQGPLRRLRITNQYKDPTQNQTEPLMELHLLFRNDHYDSLHDETKLDEKARLSLTVGLAGLDHSTDADATTPAMDEMVSTTTSNQCEVEVTKKPRKGKRVVFLGEQTRVERVEMPAVVLLAPRRAVLHRGRVRSVTEPTMMIYTQEETQQVEEDDDTESEDADNEPPQNDNSDDDVVEDDEEEVRFATVKRICFQRGRRIE